MILAAAAAESLSGGAGWAGAGLLGLILSWLLYVHLPNKDKQLSDFVAAHNKTLADLYTQFAEERKEQLAQFKESLDTILDRAQRDADRNYTMMRQDLTLLRDALNTLAEAVRTMKP